MKNEEQGMANEARDLLKIDCNFAQSISKWFESEFAEFLNLQN